MLRELRHEHIVTLLDVVEKNRGYNHGVLQLLALGFRVRCKGYYKVRTGSYYEVLGLRVSRFRL